MNALTVLLLAAATFRLTRLLAVDTITQPLRDLLDRWAAEGLEDLNRHRTPRRRARFGAWAQELVGCPWCLSTWLGFAVSVAWWAAAGVADPLLWVPVVALTCSAFTGLLSQAVAKMDDD